MLGLFKSYYVVWKRKREEAIAQALSQFKSYYVVWKRKREEAIAQALSQGLNRTM